MADQRIREWERLAAIGDPDAVGRLRSWKARRGECEHAFYVIRVERYRKGDTDQVIHFYPAFKAFVNCEFCSFREEAILQYNPLDELHRLRIELEANGKLSFVIDETVTTCFRLGFVRLGTVKWDPLGRSLVTNNSDWLQIARVNLKRDWENGLAVHARARGVGEIRVLRNGVQVTRVVFVRQIARHRRGAPHSPTPLSQASFIPGPLNKNDILDVEIRYTGLPNERI